LTTFDEDDVAGALAELERRYEAENLAERSVTTAAWRTSLAQEAAAARRDWDAFAATLHPAYEYVERRRVMWMPAGAQPDSYARTMFALDEWHLERTLLATRGDRVALVRQSCRFHDGASGPAESTAVAILEVAEDGRVLRETPFDTDDLDAALVELEARAAATPRPNRAWESVVAAWEAFDRRDWDAFVGHHVPAQVMHHRQRGTAHTLVGSDAFRSNRVLWEMDEVQIERRLVATDGERVALVEFQVHGSDGAVEAFELLTVNVVEIAENGCIAQQTAFDPEDADAALEHLHERARATAPEPNAAARLVAEQQRAFARRDLESFRSSLGSGFTVDDKRRTAALRFDEEQSVATLRYAFDLPGLQWHRPLLATRGDQLALTRDELVSRLETNEIDYESASLTLVELGADGHLARHIVFDVDDLPAAIDELDARAAELRPDPLDVSPEGATGDQASKPDVGL
jgi:hypothetical protein